MNNGRVILPFNYPPVIDTFSGVAGNVAVMMLNNDNKFLIFRNHFLLSYNYNIGAPGFNWLYYDDSFRIAEDIRDQLVVSDICDYIKKCIDMKYYVHIFLDHFYLSVTREYKKEHKIHDSATIWGYDEHKKIFILGDNFNNGRYSIKEVSYSEFVEARVHISEYPAEKFKIRNEKKMVNKNLIILLLKSYLHRTCYLGEEEMNYVHSNLLENDVVYGMAIYDIMLQQVENYNKDCDLDIRTFHILVNHMNLYIYLCEMLELSNSFINKANRLIQHAILIRNSFIKYSITMKNKERLKEHILNVCRKENDFILEMLDYFGVENR